MPATPRALLHLPGTLKIADGRSAMLTLLDAGSVVALGTAFAVMSPWADYPYRPEALIDCLSRQDAEAPRIAIRLDGQIAGVMGLRLRWLLGPYIQFLGILPGEQGRGFGAPCSAGSKARRAQAGSAISGWPPPTSIHAREASMPDTGSWRPRRSTISSPRDALRS